MKSLVLSLVVFLALPSVRPAELDEGLTFYASFDRRIEADWSVGATSRRFAGEDLLLLGLGQHRYDRGKVGDALSLPDTLPGADIVLFPSEKTLSSNAGTLMLWVRPRWPMTQVKYHVFADLGFALLYKYTDTKGVDFATRNVQGNYVYGCGASAAGWKPGEWHNLAVTWDAAPRERKLYLDGKPASKAVYPFAAKPSASFALGSFLNGASGLDGLLDEVYLYRRALTEEAIAAAVRAGQQGTKAVGDLQAVTAPPVTLAEGFRPGLALHIPFDGETEATRAEGDLKVGLESPRLQVAYENGMIGKAVSIGTTATAATSLRYVVSDLSWDEAGTVAFWVRPRWDGTDVTHYYTLAETGHGLVYKYTDHRMIEFAVRKAESGDYDYGCGADISSWKAGEWHHVAFAWDHSQGKRWLFLDGQASAQRDLPPTLRAGNALCLGSGVAGANAANCLLDEAYVWRRALGGRGIYEAYAAGLSGQTLLASERLRLETSARTRPPQVDWSVDHAFRVHTLTRDKLCLNGLWQFRPIVRGENPDLPPATAWGYLQVPGDWTSATFPVRDASFKPTVGWFGESLRDARIAWYRREFVVPADWRGSRVRLRIMDVGNVARILLNGNMLGEVTEWEDHTLDLTPHVKFAETNDLALRVQFLEPSGLGSVFHAGLVDDVWLERVPTGVRFEHVGIKPSVRRKELRLRLRLFNPRAARDLFVTGVITHDGRPEKRLGSQRLRVGKGETVVDVRYAWPNPHLWWPSAPYLYSLSLRLEDGTHNVLDVAFPERFGFRELWIEGGKFMLNGSKVFLVGDGSSPYGYHFWHCTREFASGYFSALRSVGANLVRACFPWETGTNFIHYLEVPLEVADEQGMMFLMHAPEIIRLQPYWNNSSVRAGYQRRLRKFVERYENHPSLVLWYTNFNYLLYPWYIHPSKLADVTYYPKNETIATRAKVALESAEMLRKADDSRPVFQYSCGNLGPIETMNLYLGHGIPIQEQEDWLSAWSRVQPKPIMPVEIGFPVICYWYARKDFPLEGIYASEPLFTEYAAMPLGDEAYRLPDSPEGANGRGPKTPYGRAKMVYTERIVRAWRGYGLSGICPHAELFEGYSAKSIPQPQYNLLTPGPKPPGTGVPAPGTDARAASMRGTYGLVTASIAGHGERLTNKDHSFRPGEAVYKRILALNESPAPVEMTVAWEVLNERGVRVAGDSLQLRVAPGTRELRPLVVRLPKGQRRADYALRLRAKWGSAQATDVLNLEAIPLSLPPKVEGKVVVYDPKGLTTAALRKLGCGFTAYRSPSDLDGARLLIIGRQTLEGAEDTFREAKLRQRVEAGLNLLCFEQEAKSLAQLDLRADTLSFREAYVRAPEHPALAGLSNRDLHDLRGDSDLIEAYPEPDPATEYSWPKRFWKWGNSGVVCTFPIVKPHFANCRALLDDGFDLEMSPLLEWFEGRGGILLCQVDVTNRCGTDPASSLLVQNLVASAAAPSERPMLPAQYVGGPRGENLVKQLCVTYDKADAPAGQRVTLVGEELSPQQEQALAEWVRNGGTALLLPRTVEDGLPPPVAQSVRLEKRTVFRDEFVTSDLTAGLGPSDLFLKRLKELPVFASAPKSPVSRFTLLTEAGLLACLPEGKGRYVLCQLHPDRFCEPDDLKKWDDFSGNRAWVKVLRVWSTLLTNLGVQVGPSLMERFESPMTVSVGLAGKWKFRLDPQEIGLKEGWQQPKADDSGWQELAVPGFWEALGIRTVNLSLSRDADYDREWQYDGVAWYRKRVTIPESFRGREVRLHIAAIDDFDTTYLNGVQIGHTGQDTPNWYIAPRDYVVPPQAIRFGQENVVAVRVEDNFQAGGFRAGPVELVAMPKDQQRRYAESNFNDDPYKFVQY